MGKNCETEKKIEKNGKRTQKTKKQMPFGSMADSTIFGPTPLQPWHPTPTPVSIGKQNGRFKLHSHVGASLYLSISSLYLYIVYLQMGD